MILISLAERGMTENSASQSCTIDSPPFSAIIFKPLPHRDLHLIIKFRNSLFKTKKKIQN
jgi:hypothetical protein